MIVNDAITEALGTAIDAVSDTLPSQSALVAFESSRRGADGEHPLRCTVKAVFTSAGFADPVTDVAPASEVAAKYLIIAKHGDGAWPWETPPRFGDVAVFEDGSRFSVFAVEEKSGVYYRIGVKEFAQCRG